MLNKPTEELLNDLLKTNNIDQYVKSNQDYMLDTSIAQHIESILQRKNLNKVDVIRDSEINEIYAYQIFAGKRKPSRDKLISLCYGMKLTLNETQQLLKFAGFAPLYAKNKRDSVIIYSINNAFSIIQTNSELYRHNHKTL